MQPNRDPANWQQPTQQPAQAPYVVNPVEEIPQPASVVTPAPDDSSPESVPPLQTVSLADEEPQPEEEMVDEAAVEEEPVRWQAHEYIHHERSPGWFILFSLVVVVLILLAIFLMQSITFAILVPVMAAALLVYTHRPPRVLDYTLSRQGLHINDRLYPFAQFKGFGVIHDGLEYSVMLLPIQRFKPGVSVYFPEESGEAIVDMLGGRLPMQELHLDMIDKIVHKLRI
jgi:hypothetical protein